MKLWPLKGVVGAGNSCECKDSETNGPIIFPVSHQLSGVAVSFLAKIIAPSLGFVLCALIVALLLRGKDG